jgi:hypothetical protein
VWINGGRESKTENFRERGSGEKLSPSRFFVNDPDARGD